MESETRTGLFAAAVKAHAALAVQKQTRTPSPAILGERWMPPDRECVSSVRRFVRDLTGDWKAGETVSETAELLVSELATNALVHSSAQAPIHVAVIRDDHLLTVEVRDSCAGVPSAGPMVTTATKGRGLPIVQHLAHNWGWTLTPTGKAVWFQLVAWPEA
ncbi:ATP-binding protein [Nonomuraea sp. K274]|uniref:ATP-binding protein n=1 Tax=Nonomuraea cypriaca TaxID=1187855 RepID=A0A931AED7_9ACTN|nr:ATP-binding protein [Nonomuraea cypriaca]MBF8191427.1 ATP-binding protein [Nonomuraea cypriaca]